LTQKEKLRITNRETLAVLGLYLLFFVWWYATAYGFGSDPAKYSYILGFPEWFFFSCIVGYAGISLLLWAVVKYFFKEIPFDDEDDKND